MKRSVKSVWLLLIAVCMATWPMLGCTSDEFTVNTYKTLKTCSISYDACMKSVADAQKTGLIDDETRLAVNDKAHHFLSTFKTAAAALYAYEGGKAADATSVAEAVLVCRKSISELIGYVRDRGVDVQDVVAE